MQEEKPKVSIIVLTYNRFDEIKRNIESIIRQQYDSYEVIISDDGSPNLDKPYLESLFLSDKTGRFSIISREKNIGTVRNYNRAIEQAKGDIIVPLSQDDYFYSDHALTQIEEAFKDTETNVCLGLRIVENKQTILPNVYQQGIIREGDKKKTWFRNACKNMLYGAALYYRRDYLLNAGIFDESYDLLEDYPFIMKAIENSERITVLNEPTVVCGSNGVSSGSYKGASERLVNDQIRLRKTLYESSTGIIKSHICKRYLDYLLCRWQNAHKSFCIQRLQYPIISLIVLFTKIMALIKKEDVMDCRFKLLWRIETKVSR